MLKKSRENMKDCIGFKSQFYEIPQNRVTWKDRVAMERGEFSKEQKIYA
jgi:hypothetical protein